MRCVMIEIAGTHAYTDDETDAASRLLAASAVLYRAVSGSLPLLTHSLTLSAISSTLLSLH